MTTDTPPPEPGRTGSGRNRPVPFVIGILLALVGFPLLLGGLGLGWAVATKRDDHGSSRVRTVRTWRCCSPSSPSRSRPR